MKDPIRRAAIALSDLIPLSRAADALGVHKTSISLWRREKDLPLKSTGRMKSDRHHWCAWCGETRAEPGFCGPECRAAYLADFESEGAEQC